MSLKKLALGLALAASTSFAAPAIAQDSINFVHNTYRTGPFSGSGIPVADGVRDYFALINSQGGVNGVRINFEECETAYDTRRSVECYEQGKAKNSILYVPWSTGAALAAIPRAHLDKIPILSMGYGLSASAVGDVFPWVFNLPITYWDGANAFIQFVAQQEGGFDKLRGKTIGLLHLDAPFGKEPIPILEALARQHGFNVKLYPVPPAEMQNQSSMWLGIRRDRTDWVYLQGWGAMNPTAVREASRAGFPVNRLVGVWWAGGDDDARPAGDAGRGYRALNWHQTGANFPVIQQIITNVVDRGQSLSPREKVGENLYNRGVYQAMLIVEAIRNAQAATGKRVITGEDMRRGLESLNMTAERWTALGAPGFASPFRITCSDHNSQSAVYVMEWDGRAWRRLSQDITPQRELVRPMLEEAARAFAASNAGWPQRTEACQNAS